MNSPDLSRRPLIELLALAVVVGIDLWWLRLLPSVIPAVLAQTALVAVVASSYLRRKRRLSTPSPKVSRRRAWLEAGASTLLVVALLAAIGLKARSEPYDEIRLFALHWPLLDQIWLLCVALGRASIQQLMLLGFLWPVGLELFKRESTAGLFAAAFFAVTHLPNPFLVTATFVGGCLWVWLFSRGRRAVPILLSHVLLATALFALIPERTLRGLHVGAKAVVRASRYEVYEQEETSRLLRQICSSDGAAVSGVTASDPVDALFRHVLGRPATVEEMEKWAFRTNRLSRCSAAKKLAMTSQPL